MNKGVFQISREVWESEINRKPAEWFKFWIYIISRSNFKATKEFERGEAYYNLPDVAMILNIKLHTIYNFIKWSKSTRQITTRKSTRGIYIKVLNYAKYQDLIKGKNQTENQTENQTGTRQEPDYSRRM